MKLSNPFNFLKNKTEEGLYIQILLWAYYKQATGFTRQELEERFASTDELRAWVSDIFFWGNNNDRPLIKQFTTRDNIGYYTLTDKGISSAVDYLELKHAIRNGMIASLLGGAALIVAIFTGWVTFESLQTTQDSLELTAPVSLNIIADHKALDIDQVETAAGMIPATSSKAYLKLVNDSTPTIVDADIRMTLWAIDRAEGESNFRLCPMGYVDHYDNPNFEVSDIRVDNVLNTKFTLRTGAVYPFTFDFSNLGLTDFWGNALSEKSARFVKIDVIYKKKVGHIAERYTKILRIFNNERLVDVDSAPEFGSMFASGKISTRENPYDLPSVFYPFQNAQFIQYFKNLPRPDNISFSECQIFNISKENPVLVY